ncbi:endoribonuclease CG2145-like [Ischnura elegans]|uniref:endoribonuclease CG2145-like n=1 Tax=Ischnura elegans TaxID=197161 RepID=UPI001ED8AC46|nr:endoribonuclease CG2145-like [Ischnura elegans]
MALRKTILQLLSMTIFIIYTPTFSNTATSTASISDKELQILSEDLLKNDINNVADLITVNLQSQVRQGNKDDAAPSRLLTVNPKAWEKQTIGLLQLLFDNFDPDVKEPEEVTPIEQYEVDRFLDAILKTPIMEITRNFLATKGYVSYDLRSFKEFMYEIWFQMYPRGKGKPNSSGFEHVFIGELKGRDIGGFHNWVRFYNEEQQNRANYLGFIEDKATNRRGGIIKLTFKWDSNFKPIGSIFVGTSPEFEMALYTVCFLARPNRTCPIKLNGLPVIIQTHQREYNGKVYIGTAYPAN